MLSKLYRHQNRTQLELFKLLKLEFCVSELGAQLVNRIHVMIRIYLFMLLCFAVPGESWLGRKNRNQNDMSSTSDIWSCCSFHCCEWFSVSSIGWLEGGISVGMRIRDHQYWQITIPACANRSIDILLPWRVEISPRHHARNTLTALGDTPNHSCLIRKQSCLFIVLIRCSTFSHVSPFTQRTLLTTSEPLDRASSFPQCMLTMIITVTGF